MQAVAGLYTAQVDTGDVAEAGAGKVTAEAIAARELELREML